MRVQKLALAVGLVSALGGNGALALGLGEIKLNSTLNQPLNAEIKLLQTRGLGETEIKVRLATTEDFDRAGVDRAYFLTELSFAVDYSGNEPIIRISSRKPIREPFLNFLIETRWPSGRLLREYTLLMDLPAFSSSTASQPVRAAERERQQVRREAPVQKPLEPITQRAPEPVQAPAEVPAPEPAPEYEQPQATEPTPVQPEVQEPVYEAPAESAADNGSRVYGPVEANKTLWEIARDNRETRSVSVQQTMLAIQRLNPEAFINNNINLLKKGAVLRLPTDEEVRTLTLREAVVEVATQNEAWRERVGGSDAAMGAPLDGRAATEESAESEALEGRVTLAAPGDNESVTSGSGSGAGESEALSGELAVTEEELDKSRLENTELQERIGELNEQIDTMERLVEVSSEEMRAVQDAAAQTDEDSEGSVNETGEIAISAESDLVAEEGAEVDAAQDGVESGLAEEADEPVTAPETAEDGQAQDDSRNRVVVQTQSEPTLVDRLMENIQLIGIGVGTLLVGLFGFFTWRRRKEEEEAIRQVEAEMAAEGALDEGQEHGDGADQLSAVEKLEADSSFDLDNLGEVETGDPVAEAEIYLSLGQYNEAEAKLLSGLEVAPDNVDARLMLLEVYAEQQNVSSFDDHYRQLLSYSDGPAADRAARLRETIANAGPFEAPEVGYSSESLEAAQLDDLGADFDDSLDAEASFDDLDEFSGADRSTDEFTDNDDDFGLLDDLNLELDSDFDAAPGGAAAGESDEFSLDLDLGDDLTLDNESVAGAEGESASGDFDLDSLELDSSFGSAATDAGEVDTSAVSADMAAESSSEEPSGLEFDLDLSPMDDSDDLSLEAPAAKEEESASLDDDEFDTFGADLDGLDLDSIDLGELDLGDDLESGSSEEPSAPAIGTEQIASAEPEVASAEQVKQPESDGSELEDLSFNLESDLDSELNLLDGSDEVSTKLELAQAYLDMGDKDGAREILGEVVEEAAGEQQQRAKEMLERMS